MQSSCMKAWGKSKPPRCSTSKSLLLISFSYSIFRVIDDYYADGEAAYDMRKPLSRDKERKTIRENGKNVHVEPYRVW